jgi:succinate dehydrogenase hydrophobic anchor subunit
MTRTQPSIFSTSRALLIAAGLIAGALALRWLSPEYIGKDVGQRALGVMLGMLVVVYANAVPKMLAPLLQGRDAAREQALRRFTGVALVLGGLAYALAWMLAPLDRAALVAGSLLACALVLVIARWAWAFASASRTERK